MTKLSVSLIAPRYFLLQVMISLMKLRTTVYLQRIVCISTCNKDYKITFS